MPGAYDEQHFEAHVVDELASQSGWQQQPASALDRDNRLVPADLVAWLQATQPDKVATLAERLGGNWQASLARTIARDLDKRPGRVLHLLRHGKNVSGVHLDLATFRPTHGLNPEIVAKYAANVLTVMRQVPYSPEHSKTLDLALFVNGLPVATIELKTRDTAQSITDAVAQYRSNRDPHDTFLARRAVVHFAVDTEAVQMTTTLAGQDTRFLPFNRGSRPDGTGGAGNFAPADGGHPSSYLWRQILARDTFLDILARFIHVEPADGTDAGSRPTMIFPRYHQWDSVTGLEDHAREHGAGHNYLVQHSAGSGKTNSIGWLAHRLATLHRDDAKVFDKVIVITDRTVLDRALQAKIEQFELKSAKGYVRTISKDSTQLAEALESRAARVVVTTLQKFPYVLDKVSALEGSTFAVIIDEAHSSQSGEAAGDLRKVLTGTTGEQALAAAADAEAGEPVDPVEAAVAASAAGRGRSEHLSMFAFTATPKGKTLELFGTRTGEVGVDGTPLRRPFHLYSMRQAIEEEFILDMLTNYMTYATYWRLATSAGDELTEQSRAASAAAKFASLHPHVIDQKVEVIVEHFREHVQDRMKGRAKAMVVTRSRLHAVRTKRGIDAYLHEHGITDLAALVAFSGTVVDPDLPDEGATESSMNEFPDSQTAARFATDDYQVMVVAEKYQTGFDQPLLCAMYVDKRLSGVNAVQTLGRLNRSHPDKSTEDVVVLDFVNEADDIRVAFDPYYQTTLGSDTDPQVLYETWERLADHLVVEADDIDAFAELWFTADPDDPEVNAQLAGLLRPAVARFEGLDEVAQEDFRATLSAFNRMYSFLSQVLTWADTDLEKAHPYTRQLARRVAERSGTALDLSDDLELTHFRLADTGTHDIDLAAEERPLTSFAGTGAGSLTQDELVLLADIIDRLNERYGLELGEEDKVDLIHVGDSMALDAGLQQAAHANSIDNFSYAFDGEFEPAILEIMQRNQDLGKRLLDDDGFRHTVREFLVRHVHRRAAEAHAA